MSLGETSFGPKVDAMINAVDLVTDAMHPSTGEMVVFHTLALAVYLHQVEDPLTVARVLNLLAYRAKQADSPKAAALLALLMKDAGIDPRPVLIVPSG